MKIIKLNAIDSTNSYLKELSRTSVLENFTTVYTDFQTNGKGQRSNNWHSKKGKNLLFSVLATDIDIQIRQQAFLNFAISFAIFTILDEIIDNVKIKWPNDIMAGNYKICGILIENTIKRDKITNCIIGVGLNVNQLTFPKNIGKVTSLKKMTAKNYNLNELLMTLVNAIKTEVEKLNNNQFELIYDSYLKNLYKLKESIKFSSTSIFFYGKIIGVSKLGKLQVLIENQNIIKEFEIKEIEIS